MQWVAKELAIVLPYLFDSDLQYSLRQGWRHAFNGYCDHCSWKKLNNWSQCRSSLQCCNQSVHVYPTAWNRVRSMFSTVLTAITTIWRPGLMNLTQCMLCVQIYCVYRIIICYILNCEQDWVGLCFGELCVCWVLLSVWLPQTINLHRLLKFSA